MGMTVMYKTTLSQTNSVDSTTRLKIKGWKDWKSSRTMHWLIGSKHNGIHNKKFYNK